MMDGATIGLISAVLVASISVVGSLLINRLSHKDSREDLRDKSIVELSAQIMELDAKFDKSFSTLSEHVNELENNILSKIETVENELEQDVIIECRVRILRFADEIQHGQKHSQEHFQQILTDISKYVNYCAQCPQFQNDITCTSIKVIKDIYEERLKKNDFI